MKNIVIIGGGTGTFTLLKGLREFPTNNSVVVSTADDGGSTGRLRAAFGVVPPGDLRQCLVGLSYTDELLKEVFSYRFETGELAGHAVGNLVLAAAEKVSGSVEKAVALWARVLNVRGQILPVSLSASEIEAVLEDGRVIKGEHNIDEPKKKEAYKIKAIRLQKEVVGNPRAIKAIAEADILIFGPGDIFTSIAPNVLVKGVREALIKSKAKKIYVTNLMTQYEQTRGFTASTFVSKLEGFLDAKEKVVDAVIVNVQKPKPEEIQEYQKVKAEFVEADTEVLEKLGYEVIKAKLISKDKFENVKADKLRRSVLRHNSRELAKIIFELIK